MTEKINHIHVMPTDDYQPHEENAACWCQPVMIERASTGIEVWSHNRAKDGLQ